MTADFIAQTAPITGAGRGIGRAVALGLADAGAGLILLARSAVQAALTAGVLPGMLDAGWGRVANVSSAIAARPDAMVRFNACPATRAALIAHLSGDDTGAIRDVSTAPVGP